MVAATRAAPMILPLEPNDPKFHDIAYQFDVSWKHTNKRRPNVMYIYKIIQTQALYDTYVAYRNAVETKGNFVSQRMMPGNECRRWHGTRRACTLGDDPDNAVLCGSPQCALCCILTSSFRKELVGAAGRNFNRFGLGIYASATSSKAHDYSSNTVYSPYRAVILTTVVVGKGKKKTKNKESYKAAPKGFDSVLGETGNSLNFDEVVVYNNDAIRPAWLVVYGA